MSKSMLFGLSLLALSLTSCNKDVVFDQAKYDNMVSEAFVVDQVDPGHTWATLGTGHASIAVNDIVSGNYEVTLFRDYPTSGASPVYLCKGLVENGGTLDLTFSYPLADTTLYVAAVDPNGHRQVKPVSITNGQVNCHFGEQAAASRRYARQATTTDQPYSVPAYSAPDLSAYNQGSVVSDATNRTDNVENYYRLSSNWTGVFHPLAVGSTSISAPVNVYVTAKWTINGDQRVNGGCNVIVAPGGEIVINAGANLSTNDDHIHSGMIYVLPGGKITGDGLLALNNGTQGAITAYSYNGGTIDVNTINLNGGTLYNASHGQLRCTQLQGGASGSRLINQGNAHIVNAGNATTASFGSTTAGLQVWNACQLVVDRYLCLGGESRIDDGGYVECGEFFGGGSNAGGIFLAMGHNAVLNVVQDDESEYHTGAVKFNNFGIQGPASAGTGKAIVAFSQALSRSDYTAQVKDTYIYNYVELVVPSSYDIYAYDNGQNIFYGMMNARNWNMGQNVVSQSEQNVTISHDTPSYTVDADDCSRGISSGASGQITPRAFSMRYCFEDNFPDAGDYDFNDAVITLTPTVNGRTVTLDVSLDAVGATKTIGAAIHLVGVRRSDLASDPVAQGFTPLPDEPWTQNAPYDYIDTDQTFLDAGQLPNRQSDGMVVVLFKDAHWAINPVTDDNGQPVNKFYNTMKDRSDSRGLVVEPKTARYTLTFSSAEKAAAMLDQSVYDVFIVEPYNGSAWEVHTVQNGFKTLQVLTPDKGLSSSGLSYAQAYGTNMPWAIMTEGNTFRYPVEWQVIGRQKAASGGGLEGAYRTPGHSFAEWATNRSTATDWYNYPDASKVY